MSDSKPFQSQAGIKLNRTIDESKHSINQRSNVKTEHQTWIDFIIRAVKVEHLSDLLTDIVFQPKLVPHEPIEAIAVTEEKNSRLFFGGKRKVRESDSVEIPSDIMN